MKRDVKRPWSIALSAAEKEQIAGAAAAVETPPTTWVRERALEAAEALEERERLREAARTGVLQRFAEAAADLVATALTTLPLDGRETEAVQAVKGGRAAVRLTAQFGDVLVIQGAAVKGRGAEQEVTDLFRIEVPRVGAAN